MTEWPEFVAADPWALGELVQRKVVIDGRYCLDAAACRSADWQLRSLGRPAVDGSELRMPQPLGPAARAVGLTHAEGLHPEGVRPFCVWDAITP